jgi:hypothetical protein
MVDLSQRKKNLRKSVGQQKRKGGRFTKSSDVVDIPSIIDEEDDYGHEDDWVEEVIADEIGENTEGRYFADKAFMKVEWQKILLWKDGADKHLSTVFNYGNSRQTRWRKKRKHDELSAEAQELKKIDSFFEAQDAGMGYSIISYILYRRKL